MDTTLSKDGTTIAFQAGGQGRPLVLVHGTTADHTRWRTVLPLLAPDAAGYALDRRGRGGSGDGDGDGDTYAIEREFEDVAAVVTAAAAAYGGPVDLLGHSYGGLCAMGAARLVPELVRRLVLYEPPAGTEGSDPAAGNLERLEQLVAQGDPERVVEVFFRDVVGMPEHELELLRGLPVWPARVAAAYTIPRELRAAGEFAPDPGWFAGVTAPTRLLLGGASPGEGSKVVRQLQEALPDAHVSVLAGQQHVAMDTAPELFAGQVREFLAGSGEPGGEPGGEAAGGAAAAAEPTSEPR